MTAWADNADVISRAYSGTGALKTDFTRTGKRTRAGALADFSNSATRYFRNNFADGPRQDAYDLFLGNYLPSSNYVASHLLFVDRRPVLIQSMPYILCAAVFLELASLVLPRQGDSTSGQISLKIFMVFWLLVAVWAFVFVVEHGMLYVAWPKLNAPAFAVESYNDALNKAKKDRLVGRWLGGPTATGGSSGGGGGGRERGASMGGANIRLVHLEEGKKRIE